MLSLINSIIEVGYLWVIHSNMDIRLCSYNVCSLHKNIDVVRKLTENKYDIIFLQETFVVDDKLGEIDYIDEFYESVGVGAVYSEKSLSSMSGRPMGGMACLWKNDSHFKVNKVVLDDNLCIISISVMNFKIVLVNVYLNSDVWEAATLAKYLESLNRLEAILTDFEYDSLYFIGDFNADPFTGRAWGNLKNFMERNSLICFDFNELGPDTFTFKSYSDSHCKWLDHVIGKNCEGIVVRDIEVFYELMGSDHLPLSMTFVVKNENFNSLQVCDKEKVENHKYYVNWENLNDDEIRAIESSAMDMMGVFLNRSVSQCCKVGCVDVNHILEIGMMYEALVNAVSEASQIYRKKYIRRNKYKVIPGWNRRVKQFHSVAREHYLKWLNTGRDRNTVEFHMMNESRKQFKKALNDCKQNEFEETCTSIEEKFKNKQMTQFWQDVRKRKINSKKSGIIDGKNDSTCIINIFTKKFLNYINTNNASEDEQRLINKLSEKWETNRKFHMSISATTIRRLCKTLKKGMGHDGIHTTFLCRVSDKFLESIACIMNSSFSHCIIPNDILKGDINPTIKDLKGNSTESSNYRPVMQSSCLLKIFELHILSVLEEKTCFNFRQFGFRKGCSTSDACYILKETVHGYTIGKKKCFCSLYRPL